MATSARTKIIAVGLVSLVFLGCEGLLGTFEVAPELSVSLEAGSGDGQVTVQQDAAVDAPPEAGNPDAAVTVRTCETAFDCNSNVAIEPSGCAVIRCIDNRCRGTAVDKDSDGHAVAGCKVDGKLVSGYADDKEIPADDCADNDATVFPGGECSKTPTGTNITYPNGSPVGACKRGAWACEATGAVCRGAVGPAGAENCTLKNDANCNGIPDDGCDCDPSVTTPQPCGNTANLPLPCKKGTRTCLSTGKWTACTGNTEPQARDCTSAIDNDCSGTTDRDEAVCKCGGKDPIGTPQSCAVPGGLGVCADGSQTCQATANKQAAVYSACVGPTAGRPDCASGKDNDCNGTPDELQVGCGTGCVETSGRLTVPTAAAQKFVSSKTGQIYWGCRGTVAFAARANLCQNGKVCTSAQWNAHGAGKPTRKYWLAEKMNYGSGTTTAGAAACFASSATGTGLYDCGTDQSMAVCPPGGAPMTRVEDADGNVCNWSDCVIGTSALAGNDYMGGCANNVTGGALCCP